MLNYSDLLSKNIKFLLEEKGWKQGELCKRAHLTDAAISRILTGKMNNPQVKTLEAIAHAFGITIAELLNGEERPEYPELTYSESIIKVMTKLNRLPGLLDLPECLLKGLVELTDEELRAVSSVINSALEKRDWRDSGKSPELAVKIQGKTSKFK